MPVVRHAYLQKKFVATRKATRHHFFESRVKSAGFNPPVGRQLSLPLTLRPGDCESQPETGRAAYTPPTQLDAERRKSHMKAMFCGLPR